MQTFANDLQFLQQYHPDLLLLSSADGLAQVIVLPAYQGRVMTTTAAGPNGQSFGWINYAHIQSGAIAEHMNVYGGEERFWMGPEGGQFALFFQKGVPFTFEHWFVPKALDTEPFQLVSHTPQSAHFEQKIHLENYAGTAFEFLVTRHIHLLNTETIARCLGIDHLPEGLQCVGFESDNALTNIGTAPWEKATGLLSIWMSSMLNASDTTTVVIPYQT